MRSIRGVYGGIPDELLLQGKTLADCGINAIWIGSGGLTTERVALLRQQGARVFVEFNTMHVADYLKDQTGAGSRYAPTGHGRDGLRLGRPAPAAGQSGRDGRRVPRHRALAALTNRSASPCALIFPLIFHKRQCLLARYAEDYGERLRERLRFC